MNARQRQSIDPMRESSLDKVAAARGRRRFFAVLATAVAVGSTVLVASPASAAVLGTPVADQDDYLIDEDTVLMVEAPGVLANDDVAVSDPTVTFSPLELISSAGNNADGIGTLTPKAGGGFEYAPGPDFYGNVKFTYVVNDGVSDSDPVAVNITVRSVNDGPPVGTPDSYEMVQGSVLSQSALVSALLSNDEDVDADVLQASLGSVEPSHGHVSIADDGSVVYTPLPDFSGVDTFTYDVFDGTASVTGILVTITVRPLPTTTITSGPATVSNSRTATFTITSNYSDATIQCFLGSAAFVACDTFVFNNLGDGSHTFSARAVTQDGLIDATPATWTWTVDATAPVPKITSPANGSVFTQGQIVAAIASCNDDGVEHPLDPATVDTSTVGSGIEYSASCTDAAGNSATVKATYSVVAPTPPPADPPPVVQPPAPTPTFDVRWLSAGKGSAFSSLNGAHVSGQIKLILTDATGAPVGRDRSIRSVSFRIVDAAGKVIVDGTDRWSPFTFGRGHHHDVVIDTTRWANGTYRLETVIIARDDKTSTVTSSFDVANAARRHPHRGWGRDCD